MNRNYLYGFLKMAACAIPFLSSSCGSSHEPVPEPSLSESHTSVLLYAVASNNLYGNLLSDKKEIAEGAKGLDLKKTSFYIYEVTPSSEPVLSRLQRVSGDSCAFVPVKTYDREIYSTDPARISEVIEDFRGIEKSNCYGLVLWSHGTGIDPSFSTHGNNPVLRSFGSDINNEKDSYYKDQTDIDELADAIPDGMFDFIWFDACYMSGIETVYELRHKCNYFVGYPTEVFSPGMPYDLTVPYILRETPDLCGAAEAFFRYYNDNPTSSLRVATVAVLDMSKIESVAEYCRNMYDGALLPDPWSLQRYTRGKIGPFYDFGQYTVELARTTSSALLTDGFYEAMSAFVLYKAATEVDFNYREISPEKYSGISCHFYDPSDATAKGEYYRTLEWFKRVYEGIDFFAGEM